MNFYRRTCFLLAAVALSLGGCATQSNKVKVGEQYAPAVDHRAWAKMNEPPRRSGAHDRFVTVYVNDLARQVKDRGGNYQPGSIILKETFVNNNGAPGALDRIFAMEKREPGFAPRSNDWYWIVTDPAGQILLEGDEAALNGRRCAVCHAGS